MSELQPYMIRIFLAADHSHVKEFVELLQTTYKLPALDIETFKFTHGHRQATFERVVVPDLPPIYLILLENSKVGPRRVKAVFDLIAYSKGSSAIIYVHDSAITAFKLAVLHNFPIVLFHNKSDFESYFTQKYLGDDEREVIFVLKQKQAYVTSQIVFRDDFARMKEQKSSKRSVEGKKNHQEKPIEVEMRVVRIVKRENKTAEIVIPAARVNQQVPPPLPHSPSPKVVKETVKKPSWTLPVDVEDSAAAVVETMPLFNPYSAQPKVNPWKK
jgi:hypothetical protein